MSEFDNDNTPQDEAACQAFQEQMPTWLTTGEYLGDHPHLASCARCRALVADLEAIAEAARQLMPVDADPPDELWSQIEKALERDAADNSPKPSGGESNG